MLRVEFARLSGYGELPHRDQLRLLSAAGNLQRADRGRDLVVQGTSPTTCFLIVKGLAGRSMMSDDGNRQIVSLLVPGDFADLPSLFLQPSDHSIACLTDCEVVHFPHSALLEQMQEYGPLTAMLWRNTLVDGAIARKWLAVTANLHAEGRMAHLICEMYLRYERIDMARDLSFELPLSQNELSDVLGLSPVHVNRTIRALRDSGVVHWESRDISITSWDALTKLAQFDPRYLGWGSRPGPLCLQRSPTS